MKFTKEQAFESLKGILTNNGKKTLRMSEKSVNKQLDALIPLVGNDEMELADFIEKVKTTFETMNSNVEKDNSDFVKQWEKDHKSQDPAPAPQPSTANQVDQATLDRIAALEKQIAENERKTAISQKRTDIIAAMQKAGVKDKEWINEFLDFVTIDENTNVEDSAKKYVEHYNKRAANTPPNVTPLGGAGGGAAGNEKILESLKRAGEMAKRERQLASATIENS